MKTKPHSSARLRRELFTISIIAFAPFAHSCRDVSIADADVGIDLYPRNKTNNPSSGNLIYRDSDSELRLSSSSTLFSLADGKDLFVAKFYDSRPALIRPAPLKTWSVGNKTLGLYAISSQSDLASLAMVAHQSKGFSCGNLELLTPNTPLMLTPVVQTFPWFDSSAKLSAVTSLIKRVNVEKIASQINSLSTLKTRYHTTETGASAVSQIHDAMTTAGANLSALTVNLYSHESKLTNQQSVIARIEGKTSPNELVILGAHLDSINGATGPSGVAPGADDNASGVASLIESIRAIAEATVGFARTVEFHAYAAEEVGLIGSTDIANAYAAKGIKVVAMLQLDMTAFRSNPNSEPKIYLVDTDTSSNITWDLAPLVQNYLGLDFAIEILPAGTSDHKSWTKAGFRAGFAFENPIDYNPHLHTAQDTTSQFNDYIQSGHFVRLALAFVAHYAGISDAESEYASQKANLYATRTELPTAIFGGNEGLYKIAITSQKKLVVAHICHVAKDQSPSCKGERYSLIPAGTHNGKDVYATGNTPKVPLEVGNTYRLYAYGDGKKLIGVREIILKQKN